MKTIEDINNAYDLCQKLHKQKVEIESEIQDLRNEMDKVIAEKWCELRDLAIKLNNKGSFNAYLDYEINEVWTNEYKFYCNEELFLVNKEFVNLYNEFKKIKNGVIRFLRYEDDNFW